MTFPFQSSRPRQQMSLDSVANWPTRTVGPGARVERWRNRCPSSPAKYLTWADVIDHHVVGFVQTSCQHSTKHKCTNCQKLFQYHEWLNCTKLTSSEWGDTCLCRDARIATKQRTLATRFAPKDDHHASGSINMTSLCWLHLRFQVSRSRCFCVCQDT